MISRNTIKALESGKISYSGPLIKNCDKCGADIRFARLVRVYTADEYKAMQWRSRSND